MRAAYPLTRAADGICRIIAALSGYYFIEIAAEGQASRQVSQSTQRSGSTIATGCSHPYRVPFSIEIALDGHTSIQVSHPVQIARSTIAVISDSPFTGSAPRISINFCHTIASY
jgi:hypothetical protein